MPPTSIFRFGRSGTPEDPLVVESGTPVQTDFTYGTFDGVKLATGYVENGQQVTVTRDTDGSVLSVTKAPVA